LPDRQATADPVLEHVGLTAEDLAAVLGLVAGTEVTELEVNFGAGRVSLRRPPSPISESAASMSGVAESVEEVLSLAIASPLVGIFRPSVKPGDAVQHGQSIGAIEALGMPTSVDAPQGGTVEDLLVHDGSPVEYGQPLVVLRKA
jgi:biotin carboxyl carrier protein